MAWEVEYTDEFGDWWNSLHEPEQDSIAVTVRLLQEKGPGLSFPSVPMSPDHVMGI